MVIAIHVCPDCGAWDRDTANGFPVWSSCEYQDHRPAVVVEMVPAADVRRALNSATTHSELLRSLMPLAFPAVTR